MSKRSARKRIEELEKVYGMDYQTKATTLKQMHLQQNAINDNYQYRQTSGVDWSTSGVTTFPGFAGASWTQPMPTAQDIEIAKVKKTVYALAQLLAAVFDKGEECETRCGTCVPCLISASLEELTKEQMAALAGDDDDVPNNAVPPTTNAPITYPSTYTYPVTTTNVTSTF